MTLTTPAAEAPPSETTSVAQSAAAPLPYTLIRARAGWQALDIGELWRYRHLLREFVFRDFRIRYKETVVGILWVVLQPLVMMTIFSVFFTLLGASPMIEGVPPAVTIYAGLLLWGLFSTAMGRGSDSLVENQGLIGKVYFCRLILPLAPALVGLVDFCVAFVLLLAMMAWLGIALTWQFLFVPVFVAQTVLLALTASLWLSALSAAYRDVRIVVPFCTQVLFFMSPIFYSAYVVVPERWRALYFCNPLAGVVEGFRWSVFGGQVLPIKGVLFSFGLTVVLLFAGVIFFRRMERTLADWV